MSADPRHAPTFAIVASVLMMLSFLFAGWAFYESKRSACAGRDKALAVVNEILARGRPTQAELRAMPADRRDRATSFYRFAESRIREARC